MKLSIRVPLIGIFTALGVVFSPFFIPILTSKAFPAQHMINALAGVLMGPIDAVIIALFIGILRNVYQLGTIYAFPGGLPGGFVVGITNILLRKYLGRSKAAKISVWTEPIGTVLIGATLSLFVVAPWIADERMFSLIKENVWIGLLSLYGIWSLSSFSGVIIAFILINMLDKSGFLDKLSRDE